MPSTSTSTPPSTSRPAQVRLVAFGVVATLLVFLASAIYAGTANAEPQSRLVWVCKYVGSPDDPRFQRVISVSSTATDGTWFTDAQLPSKVIREVGEDENPGQPPAELADECPETPPGPETPTETSTATTTTSTSTGTSTSTPDTPGAAPTDLGPTQTTGILALFAIAAGLILAAARLLRGARH